MPKQYTNQEIKVQLDTTMKMVQRRRLRCANCSKYCNNFGEMSDHWELDHAGDHGRILQWINDTSPTYTAPE